MTFKKHIYFVPGMAANSKIFDYLNLPSSLYELHFLEWLIPTSKNETLESYAQRMALLVTHKNAVLIGVSLGGIMVQEMSVFLNPEKIIIISSIKHPSELPKRLLFFKKTKLYWLFPTKLVTHLEKLIPFIFIPILKKRVTLYQRYFAIKNEIYINWAIHQALNWNPTRAIQNIAHIQGTRDHIFPSNYVKNPILISKGTHIMILTKAKEISAIITNLINC
ncbi:alpha/beta hydrolase [Lutibacter sp.]|uniref:alpha/beta hydrolase n=1 Tax=Lutibacter sp. TaxID=1925666 RepID=UPI0027360808|nr:alpha/beta hydrolase [Lutibacter sp.]MDP3313094.1 alpha/beta hydrolase [Lutibacter sp.]